MSQAETAPDAKVTPAYGRFVWHDLMTPDPAAARAFYAALLGWEVREVDLAAAPDAQAGEGETQPYAMIFASGAEDAPGVGGFEPLPSDADVPAHWMGYVEVESVDAAGEQATQAGGSLLMGPTEIPNVGRFCIVRDPAGGVLAPFQSASSERQPDPEPGSLADGQFVWNELLTHDTATCAAWYPRTLGWHVASQDMSGPDGKSMTYHCFQRAADGSVPYADAGMMQMPPEAGAPSHWLHYVQVDDVDQKTAQAQALGGSVHCAPVDLPGIGRFAVLADPQGAAFAIFQGVKAPEACPETSNEPEG